MRSNFCFIATTKDNLLNKRAQSIVDAKTSFIPCVKGEKDGVLWELTYGFREERTNIRRFKHMNMGGVIIEESSEGLVEVLVIGRIGRNVDGEKCYV